MHRIILLAAFALISCSTKKVITDPKTLSDKDIIITMSKGACFGSCPVYRLNIYDSGYCTFEGERNVKKMGKFGKQLGAEVFKDIRSKFEESGFSEFKEFYESNIPDLPSVVMGYVVQDSLKTVTGKRERPEEIHKLQFRLEQIAESQDGWTLLEKPKLEEKLAEKIKSEIIITTNGGPQLSRWFDNMRREHGVRIIKKLSNSLDMWLISYNPKKNTAEKMLEILHNDDFIKSAEFNIKTEKR